MMKQCATHTCPCVAVRVRACVSAGVRALCRMRVLSFMSDTPARGRSNLHFECFDAPDVWRADDALWKASRRSTAALSRDMPKSYRLPRRQVGVLSALCSWRRQANGRDRYVNGPLRKRRWGQHSKSSDRAACRGRSLWPSRRRSHRQSVVDALSQKHEDIERERLLIGAQFGHLYTTYGSMHSPRLGLQNHRTALSRNQNCAAGPRVRRPSRLGTASPSSSKTANRA